MNCSGLGSGARVPPKQCWRAGRPQFTGMNFRIPKQHIAGDPQPSLTTSSPGRQRVPVRGCAGLDASLPAGAQHRGPGSPSSIRQRARSRQEGAGASQHPSPPGSTARSTAFEVSSAQSDGSGVTADAQSWCQLSYAGKAAGDLKEDFS